MPKEIVIVGRQGCAYTEKAIWKAKNEGHNYTLVYVSSMPSSDMGEPFRSIAEDNHHGTYPCIFEVKYIGGYDDWNRN